MYKQKFYLFLATCITYLIIITVVSFFAIFFLGTVIGLLIIEIGTLMLFLVSMRTLIKQFKQKYPQVPQYEIIFIVLLPLLLWFLFMYVVDTENREKRNQREDRQVYVSKNLHKNIAFTDPVYIVQNEESQWKGRDDVLALRVDIPFNMTEAFTQLEIEGIYKFGIGSSISKNSRFYEDFSYVFIDNEIIDCKIEDKDIEIINKQGQRNDRGVKLIPGSYTLSLVYGYEANGCSIESFDSLIGKELAIIRRDHSINTNTSFPFIVSIEKRNNEKKFVPVKVYPISSLIKR